MLMVCVFGVQQSEITNIAVLEYWKWIRSSQISTRKWYLPHILQRQSAEEELDTLKSALTSDICLLTMRQKMLILY